MRSFPRHIAVPLLVATWGLLLLGGVLHDLVDHHDEIVASCEFCVASAHAVTSSPPTEPALVGPWIGPAAATDRCPAASVLDRDHPVRAPPVLS
jgi:hypothetical protein